MRIRAHTESQLRDRSAVMAALVEARIGRLADLVARGNPFLIDAERFLDRMWPEAVPERFEDLALPFLAVATDYDGRAEAVLHEDRCCPPSPARWRFRASSGRFGTAGASWSTAARPIRCRSIT